MVRKNEHDDDDEDDFEDDPFGMGDDFYKLINEQLKKFFSAMPGIFPESFNMSADMLKKMYADIFRKMNIDPRKMKDMSPEDIQNMLRSGKFGLKGPFVFGMNMGIGPDGKPTFDSFGNVKPRAEGETEFQSKRDPLVDIYEEEGELVVIVEVPGVEKRDIELRASPYELEVSTEPSEDSRARAYHKVISLPAEIEPDVAKARYKNGILEVRLKRIGGSNPKRKINIE